MQLQPAGSGLRVWQRRLCWLLLLRGEPLFVSSWRDPLRTLPVAGVPSRAPRQSFFKGLLSSARRLLSALPLKQQVSFYGNIRGSKTSPTFDPPPLASSPPPPPPPAGCFLGFGAFRCADNSLSASGSVHGYRLFGGPCLISSTSTSSRRHSVQ